MSSTSSEYEHLVINGMEAQNYDVQTFDKYDWYQVMGHKVNYRFETNAAIAQISITKVIYDDYASNLLFIINIH